jgi:hypothetical protein
MHTTFDRMSETLPPLPKVKKRLEAARDGLMRSGVPECFWRYAPPDDPRLPSILAYNRGVAHWNATSSEEQERLNALFRRCALSTAD